MAEMMTTDPEAIREDFAGRIMTIIPVYLPRQSQRFTWQKDQEVSGTLRNFDLIFGTEEEVLFDGAYGGGVEYQSEVEIRVSYPVSKADLPRFMGADGRDLSALLVRLNNDDVPGLFPLSFRGGLPIFTRRVEGDPTRYVGIFTLFVHFFASGQVELAS